ncbi:MAG TPA: hypothetical protein DCS91_13465, partial [Microcoleaceae bacterium UBA11344]|nr:hypothetical protein [Microcoleaceae cyanobacterium UBA11344]
IWAIAIPKTQAKPLPTPSSNSRKISDSTKTPFPRDLGVRVGGIAGFWLKDAVTVSPSRCTYQINFDTILTVGL